MRRVRTLALIVCCAAGCSKKDETKPAEKTEAAKAEAPKAEAPKPPPTTEAAGAAAPAPRGNRLVTATGPVKASIEGSDLTFASATVTVNGDGAEIVLSSVPSSCDEREPTSGYRLSISLPHGPGKRFYAGSDLPAGVTMYPADGKPSLAIDSVSDTYGTMSLEDFTWKPDGHLKGALDFSYVHPNDKKTYKGAGAFDAVMCGDPDEPKAPVADKADGAPVSGSLRGQKFTAASAIAVLDKDEDNGLSAVRFIELYPTAGVTCETRSKAKDAGLYVNLSQYAVSSRRTILHTKVPADLRVMGKDNYGLEGSGWIELAVAEAKPGSKITGALAAQSRADSSSKVQLSGSFEALVCE